MPKKPHPADIADRAAVEGAVGFNVHLRLGPFEKLNEPAQSLAEAVQRADRLMELHRSRRPLIYALAASGASVLVPADMLSRARQEAALAAPAPA